MKTMISLWRRELVEHRGAYVWAPLVILLLYALTVGSVVTRARFDIPREVTFLPSQRLYEDGVLVALALWWLYFAGALFFYLADAFNADKRNNAMLFWKSMPVSDFGILMSKLTFGGLAAAALAAVMTAASAVLLALLALCIQLVVPSVAPPTISQVGTSLVSMIVLAAGYSVLSVLWYAPFLAWVGALSALVGRWSIPLAFFIPGAASLIEASVSRTTYISTFLKWRLMFGLDVTILGAMFAQIVPINGIDIVSLIVLGINWPQMIGGIVVALVLVFLASLNRRRGLGG